DVLEAVSDALLSNTLSLIQDTSVTVTLTEHSFENAGTPVTGNVIDPDVGETDEVGEDDVVPGTLVTHIAVGDEDPVALEGGTQTIDGAYGTLTILDDGSYTYTPNGDPASVGQTEVFTYTI